MELSLTDLTVYVYNVAVALTMGFLVMEVGIEDRAVLVGVALVLGLFWTGYFRYSMLPKLEGLASEDEDDEPEPEPGQL